PPERTHLVVVGVRDLGLVAEIEPAFRPDPFLFTVEDRLIAERRAVDPEGQGLVIFEDVLGVAAPDPDRNFRFRNRHRVFPSRPIVACPSRIVSHLPAYRDAMQANPAVFESFVTDPAAVPADPP